jgi:outer membrane protein assembly factor BamB
VELPERIGEKLSVKELWTQDLEGEFFASPAIHEGRVYTVNKRGTLQVLDAATGKAVFEKKLTAPASSDKEPAYFPGVVLAGSLLFVGHDRGGALWLRPGKEYLEEARNLLPEGAPGTPAFADKEMFLRAGNRLYCIIAR